jgi:hypothetical protein
MTAMWADKAVAAVGALALGALLLGCASAGATSCPGETVVVTDAPGAPSSSITISCQICNPGAYVPGCQ